MSRPTFGDSLNDPLRGDIISAEQARIQNEMLRAGVNMPNSMTDSTGTRSVVRRTSGGSPQKYVIITMIDDDSRDFYMSEHGICIGNLITYNPDADWGQDYPADIIEEDGQEVFVGFVSQSGAGVPGQRYPCSELGSKTLTLGLNELTLPLVLVDGGRMVAGSLDEDHPGCGTFFDIYIAPVWSPSSQEWSLACSGTKYKAIDYREGAPLVGKYATGLFVPRVSFTHGVVLEVLDLDCVTPGSCQFCSS